MKFKKGLIATTIVLALAVPVTTFAATSNSTAAIKIRGLFGIDSSKLTSAQLADVTDYAKKMADLQKSLLDKMVSNGSMTQAQADAQKAQIDANLASGDVFVGGGRGHEGMNDGMRGGIDTSKLTDAQKTSLLALQKEQLTLQNDLAKIMVEQGLITQAQADSIKTKVDAEIAALTTASPTRGMMEGGQGCFEMLRGLTLTDTQKAAILKWAADSAAVQKKIVTLYKDAGAITQAQADTMNTQIDARAADPLNSMMMGEGKMGRGHGGHKGGFNDGFGQNGSNTGSNQTAGSTATIS